jgi:glycosyltransferase involved in cell wall biosynthesis
VAPAQVGPEGAARVAWPFPTPSGAWLEAAGLGRLRRGPGFLIGSVLLVRAGALDDVGPFDDAFFLYAEETDWQRRAADRGWRHALRPEVVAAHVGAGTGGDPVGRETHFQASHERYIRKHHGAAGWWSYRAAQLVGNAVRALVRTGPRRRGAALRLHLYRVGPLRAEAALDRGDPGRRVAPPSVVHVVVTDGFAGVERYICQVAAGLADRGHAVTVIGGAPERMAAELPDAVAHVPGETVAQAARALASAEGELVHVHMTAAEAAAFLAGLRRRRPVVATRHFAAGRGTGWRNRALARITAAPIAHDIAISAYVAQTAGGPTVLIPNAVPDRPQAELAAPQVLMLQRLDVEKAPDVGLAAWAASGLGSQGWRLVVAGNGILRPGLERLAAELGCADSVEFVGHVADTDGLLAASSILLAPAPAEPFGLSVAEAMAHGLAVVAAGGGAHLETVGAAGVHFPPGDAEAAGRALAELAADPARRRATGAALRLRQQERFALPLHLDRLEALYLDTLAGR